MTQKLGEGDPPCSPARDGGAAPVGFRAADMPVARAQRLGIACAWCGFRMEAGSPRMRLFQSDSVQAGGEWVAHFHTDCGRAILRLCAERSLADACPEIAAPHAAAEIASAPVDDAPAPTAKPSAAELGREARDLFARGFTPQMISARLRAPYALVSAALAMGRDKPAAGRRA